MVPGALRVRQTRPEVVVTPVISDECQGSAQTDIAVSSDSGTDSNIWRKTDILRRRAGSVGHSADHLVPAVAIPDVVGEGIDVMEAE